MNLFYEIFPVFLFFMAFKFYGIYTATIVGIVSTFLQVLIHRLWQGKWDNKQLITFFVFLSFGSMTLYFHNPIFVKWKSTIIFWIFALILSASHFIGNKPIAQRMLENILQDKNEIPSAVWRKLNLVWALFFVILGFINLYIAYHYSNNAWVNFKFYGVTSALFLFSLFQAFYLSRYMTSSKLPSNKEV